MADKMISGLTVQASPIATGDLFESVDISEGTLSMKNKQVTGTQIASFINTNLLGVAYVIGDIVYANSPTTLSKILAGTLGHVLTSNGPGVAPTYQAAAGGISGLTTGRFTKAGSATTVVNSTWFESGTSFLPVTDNSQQIGGSSNKIDSMYLGTSFSFVSTLASPVTFNQGGNSRLKILSTTGFIEVGAPAASTEVLNLGGAILLGTAVGTTNGTLRYTGSDFEGRIGGVWTSLSATGGMSIGGSITSATLGSVLFAGAAGVLAQDNANFFWDDTNNRLGLGVNVPTASLHVKSFSAVTTDFALKIESSAGTPIIYSRNNGNTVLYGGGFQAVTIDTGSNFTSHNYSYLKDGVALGTATPTSNTLRVPNTWNVGFGSLDSGSMVKIDGASFTNALSVVGGGATSATYSIRAFNSASASVFSVRDSGHFHGGLSDENLFFGNDSGLSASVSSSNNSGFGFHAMQDVTNGIQNTAIGSRALENVTTGNRNTGIGRNSINALTTGNDNTFIGCTNGGGNGSDNVGVGNTTLSVNTGSNNTAVGLESLSANTTGTRNTAIGKTSGTVNVLGSDLLFLGYNTKINNAANNFNNSIAIGSNATITASNQMVIGDGSSNAINNAFWGRGVSATVGELGVFSINVTGVNTGITNGSAATSIFKIAGARGTGTGLGGAVVIQTATAGASGSTQNALVDQFIVKENGTINMANLQTGNAGLASGDLYKDTAANALLNGDLIVIRKV